MISINYLEFLNNKTLYYDKIDYDVIHKSWEVLSKHINLPYIIHIVGTNGKGSTGRYIASFIKQNNKSVVHYSSPHMNEFNERIWINGNNSTNQQLQNSHEKLQKILDNDLLEKLTYFEYTTLLCFVLSSNFDFLVLEAGLGGEFDATNVVKNDITVVPSIGLDHIEFLGNTIKKITKTKLKSCDTSFILGIGLPKDAIDIKNKILQDKNEILINKNIKLPKESNSLPKYLKNNLLLAINVINYLKLNINDLVLNHMFARCQKIKNNITIDVGHNLLAAKSIKNEFKNKKIILIYNSYKDKDYENIIKELKNIIKKLYIMESTDERICSKKDIIKVCIKENIEYNIFNYNEIKEQNEYLVFGSFKVVEEFLKRKSDFEK